MTKKIFLSLVLALALVFSVLAVGNIEILEGATSLSGAAGTDQDSQFNVNNTGGEDLTGISLVPSDLVGASSTIASSEVTLSVTSLDLAAGAGAAVDLSVHIPSGQLVGTYTGNITAVYNDSHYDIMDLDVTVTASGPSVSLPSVDYDESERDQNVTKTVTVTNDGGQTLTGISLSTDAPDTWIGSYPSTLAPGASFDVVMTSFVPETMDSGLHKIGSLTFTSAQTSASSDVNVNAQSMLVFDTVKVSIDDASWDSVDEGDVADDEARPGDTFEVKVQFDNLFDDDYNDGDMDVEFWGIFRNAGEDGDDIESDTMDLGLDAGEESDIDDGMIYFDDNIIDWEAESGKQLVEIFAEGEDDNGAMHYANFTFEIDIDRENDPEFIFSRFEASSGPVCGGPLTLYIEGRSVGEDSDDEVVLKVESETLDVYLREEFEMGAYDDDNCDAFEDDEDDCTEFSLRRSFDLPSDMVGGSHTIVAELYRDGGNKQTDEESILVTVRCDRDDDDADDDSGSDDSDDTSYDDGDDTGGSGTSGTSGTTSNVDVLYTGGSQPSSSARGVVATAPTRITDTTRGEKFTDSPAYLALLSVLSVLAIIGIIVLVVVVLTKPRA